MTWRETIMGFVKTPEEMVRLSAGQQKLEFYEAQMLFVFWETKPEIVARLLPPPLEPSPYPLAAAFVAYYPKTNFGPPYHEGALCLGAQFQGVPGNYCIAMPVTGDMAMACGREKYGYPKKMAQIEFEQKGGVVSGRISRHGTPFFEIDARLNRDGVEEPVRAMIQAGMAFNDEAGSPVYLFKHFLSPGATGFDYPPRLVRQRNVLRPATLQWADAKVSLPRAECDPWHEVEVVRVLGSVYMVGNNTMLDGEVVAEVDAAAFMPYAWSKWDPEQLRLPQERRLSKANRPQMDAA
jgi:acetoacetate decarboxylase